MNQLAAMRAFLTVADERGFAPAARRLGVATSSLTRQVDALEAHLSTQLLNRSTRAVTLTPMGEVYRETARDALDAVRDADRSVADVGDRPSGLLRISLPVAFARIVVAPTLGTFARRHPEVTLEVTTTDSVVNLVDERLDLAVRLGLPGEGSLVARRLAPHRRIVCASPELIERVGAPMVPGDLSTLPCLGFTHASDRTVWRFRHREDGQGASVEVRGPLRATGSEILREAALCGVGFLLMPTWLVGHDLHTGRLRTVLPDWSVGDEEGAVHTVYLPNRRGSSKVRAFVDHLREAIGDPPTWERATD